MIPVEAAFEEVALPRLLHWAKDPVELERASTSARRRFEQLRSEGEAQLKTLLEVVMA